MFSIRCLPGASSAWFVICFVVAALSVQSVWAQSDNSFSDFAAQIPQANTEIFAVNNIYGHVEAVLKNKALHRVLEIGPLGELDIESAQDVISENRDYFPETVAISASEEIYPAFLDFFGAILRVNIGQETFFDDDYDEAEFELLQTELAKILEKFEVPDVCVWIKWSDPEMTAEQFENFRQVSAGVGLLTELKYERDEKEFKITGLLLDVVDEDTMSDWVTSMGMEDPEGEIVNALLELELFFKAELIDNGMRVSIGSDPAGKPMSNAEEMIGLRDGLNEIGYGRWNSKQMKSAAKIFNDDLNRWAKTELGKASIEDDYEDLWGSFRTLSSQLQQMSNNGHMRVWAEKNQVLADIRQIGMPEVDTLFGSPILKMIPADVESYALNNYRSYSDFLWDWVEYYEERLATISLRSELRSEFEQSEALDSIALSYYEHFGPMRIAIRDELREIPAIPFGVVMDTKGELESLQLDFELLPNALDFETDKFVRMAVVSQVSDPKQMESKLIEIYEKIVDGFFSLSDVNVPQNLEIVRKVDLGSGVMGKEFLLDWVDDADVELNIMGDLRPHVFIKGDFVVFSTSLEFSKEIISSQKSLRLEKPDANKTIVDCGRFRGITAGNMFRTLFKMAMATTDGPVGPFDEMPDVAAEFCGILNHCDWKSVQAENVRNTLYTFDFQDK